MEGEAVHHESPIMALLTNTGVKQIYIVDDDFEQTRFGVTAAKNALKTIVDEYDEELLSALGELNADEEGIELLDINGKLNSFDDIESDLDESWDDAGEDFKQRFFSAVGISDTFESTNTSVDLLDEMRSSSQCPALYRMSVGEWAAKEEEILQDQTTGVSIVLFDLSLQHADLSKWEPVDYRTAGKKLVNRALESGNPYIVPGILTGEATKPDDEIRLSNQHFEDGLPAGVMGKYRLRKGETKTLQGINGVLISNALFRMVEAATRAFRESADPDSLLQGLMRLGVLNQLSKTSYHEGTRLVDTIVRVLSETHYEQMIYQARKNYVHDPLLRKYHANEEEFWKNHLFSVKDEDGRYELGVNEGYFDGELLNECNLPTALGDVYEVTHSDGSKKWYVLLYQPCNLTVRSDGSRKSPDLPGLLAAFVNNQSADCLSKTSFPLPRSASTPPEGRQYKVSFNQCVYLPLDLLDLCALNSDGRSRVDYQQGLCAENILEPGWRVVSKELVDRMALKQERGRSFLELLGKARDKGKDENELRSMVLASVFGVPNDFCKITLTDSSVEFGLKRIGRLRNVFATGLLSEMASYRSRAAYPNTV